MCFHYKKGEYPTSKTVRAVQVFLLILIIIGVGLLLTQKVWVPKVVNYILKTEAK